MPRPPLALSLLVILLGCQATEAQRAGEVSYAEAQYEVSTSPTTVVLQVITQTMVIGDRQTMTVYGDGLVELQRGIGESAAVRTVQIGTAGVRRLLDQAVAAGLAEWDGETIKAWMSREGSIPRISDGLKVKISLRLEDYARGPYARSPLSLAFQTTSPEAHEDWYPRIPQFGGIQALIEARNAYLGARGRTVTKSIGFVVGLLAASMASAGVYLGANDADQDSFIITHPTVFTGAGGRSPARPGVVSKDRLSERTVTRGASGPAGAGARGRGDGRRGATARR